MKEAVYNIIGTVGTILLLGYLATWIFVSENNGKDYVEEYIRSSVNVKIKVQKERFEDMFDGYSYLKQIIFFKGIFGNSSNYTFKDGITGRYYKIVRFDSYGDKFSWPQTSSIDDKELYVKADPLQVSNPAFGTKENPILVFWYRGANERLMTDIQTDEKGKDGFYIKKDVQLSPTEQEYRYNVEQYLTYVMPKAEFKARFKN